MALKKAGGASAIMVGDSTFDIEAAARMGAPCVGVRTGGFGVDELEGAGAVLVADDPRALLHRRLGRARGRRGPEALLRRARTGIRAPSQLTGTGATLRA